MSKLSLDQACTIVDSALMEGTRRNLAALCAVVLDAGGHPLVLKRMESASIARPSDRKRPTADGSILQDKQRIPVVMKGGRFHRFDEAGLRTSRAAPSAA